MKSSWKVQLTLPILLPAPAELSSSPAGGSQSFRPTPGDPMLETWRWRVFPELNGLGVQCIGGGKAGTEAGEVLCFARRKPIAHSTGAPEEFDSLRQNIEHIKEIVAMREEFPELAGFTLEFPTDEARETDDAGNGNDCECPATRQAAFAATVNEL